MKRVLAVWISVFLMSCNSTYARDMQPRDSSMVQVLADRLSTLGLFRGTEIGYELERAMTRAEAVTMFVRALGKESEALAMIKTHPFTDVPSWADGYVSYAYSNFLTQGVSETHFNADAYVSSAEYLTFLLRALKYHSGTDFPWDAPYARAADCAMLPPDANLVDFQRGDAVILTVAALYTPHKELTPREAPAPVNIGAEMRLYERLIREGVFASETFEAVFPADPFADYRKAVSLLKKNVADRESTGVVYRNTLKDDLCYVTDYEEKDGVLRVSAAVSVAEFTIEEENRGTSTCSSYAVTADFNAETDACIAFELDGDSLLYMQNLLGGDDSRYVDLCRNVLGQDMLQYNRLTYTPPTYAESMDAITNTDSVFETVILKQIETEQCTIVLSAVTGTPHGAYRSLRLVYKPGSEYGEGKVVGLPLPEENAWGLTADPDTLLVSEDESTLVYTRTFTQRAEIKEPDRLIHEKGTYVYTVDLKTGEVNLEITEGLEK